MSSNVIEKAADGNNILAETTDLIALWIQKPSAIDELPETTIQLILLYLRGIQNARNEELHVYF